MVRANPRSTTFVALANGLCEAGRLVEAEEVCRQGLGQHPRLVTGQVALARALFEGQRVREAQEVLIDAVKANPEYGDGFRLLGAVVLKKGDRARARAILEYAEELLPYDARVASLLTQAGGVPVTRGPRPQTDFEHTRVSNVRAIAERMRDDTVPDDEVGDDPTIVSSPAAAQVWFSPGPSTPTPVVGPPTDRQMAEAQPPPSSAAMVARPPEAPGRRGPALSILVLLLALVGGGLWVSRTIFLRSRHGTEQADLRAEMRAALGKGSLARLIEASDLGRRIVTTSPGNADVEADLALIDAYLATDYGLATEAAAEAAADHAQSAPGASPGRSAVVAAARAVLALGRGDRGAASAEVARGLAADADAVDVLVASARVKARSGRLDSAQGDIARALAAEPDFSPAVLVGAMLSLDLGDPIAAASVLRRVVAASPDHARAHLLLAEANRAAGDGGPRSFAHPCALEGKESRTIRAECALAVAAEARLGGERAAALKNAKAALGEHETDPRLLAAVALELALLGEIDAAGVAVDRARGAAGPGMATLAWADAAIQLGRGAPVMAAPALQKPTSPEARLVAARMAFAAGGPPTLANVLRGFGAAAVAFDHDLEDLSFLARAPPVGSPERSALEARAQAGHPVAAYALGREAHRTGDNDGAVALLSRALSGHGDACAALGLLLEIQAAPGDPPRSISKLIHGKLRLLRGQNSKCHALSTR